MAADDNLTATETQRAQSGERFDRFLLCALCVSVANSVFCAVDHVGPEPFQCRSSAPRAVARARRELVAPRRRVRALIARALIGQPHVLLLDEPTAGLDLLAREQVLATVQAMFSDAYAGASATTPSPTVVVITHHTEELPPATSSVLLLDSGTV